MIEELEAEAIAQLVEEECGGVRGMAMLNHQGMVIEVRARRRKEGAAVLGYRYDGVRLERATLLLLICPEEACERSQAVKQQWQTHRPVPPALQRRTRSSLKVAPSVEGARLFEEVLVDSGAEPCIARPASFNCHVACPVNAHKPATLRKSGWDLFRNGKYVAGGVVRRPETGESSPRFSSIRDATHWLAQSISTTEQYHGTCRS
ncbi:hypothetical protein [Variovorax sp. OK605]|uniref:hypothetical protein n=1 Tax=Variovorax sp. OK605 TaxID=1855317 RepID=UPI0011607DB6|nr:hypothetical protein [Variovorax sp. OK605]